MPISENEEETSTIFKYGNQQVFIMLRTLEPITEEAYEAICKEAYTVRTCLSKPHGKADAARALERLKGKFQAVGQSVGAYLEDTCLTEEEWELTVKEEEEALTVFRYGDPEDFAMLNLVATITASDYETVVREVCQLKAYLAYPGQEEWARRALNRLSDKLDELNPEVLLHLDNACQVEEQARITLRRRIITFKGKEKPSVIESKLTLADFEIGEQDRDEIQEEDNRNQDMKGDKNEHKEKDECGYPGDKDEKTNKDKTAGSGVPEVPGGPGDQDRSPDKDRRDRDGDQDKPPEEIQGGDRDRPPDEIRRNQEGDPGVPGGPEVPGGPGAPGVPGAPESGRDEVEGADD